MVITRHVIPPGAPGVPAIYLAHFVDAVLRAPEQRGALMHEAGLSSADFHPEQRIAVSKILALVAAIDARARPGWHVEPALALEAAHHGPVGIAVSTAPSLGRALELLARFEPLRINFAALNCSLDERSWTGRILPLIDPEGPWELLQEIHLLSLAGLLERLLGGQARDLHLQMPDIYRPWKSLLLARFQGRLRFRGRHYQLKLPAAAMNAPSRLASTEIHGDAVARCEQLLGRERAGSPLAARIQARLLAAGGDFPGIEKMARDLCCSSRTLTRRLGEAGTSYRQLVDETRRMLAIDLLRRTDEPILEIADRLGYRDAANFGRACRRWFGLAPGRLRRGRD